ncbi:MAG: phytoene desaturase [Pseudomonadota bacterium]
MSQGVRMSDQGASKAIVIGAGLGGLAAGVRLAARGYNVDVFEKLDGPGGRAYVYRQDGFTFDAGPTIVTAPFLLEELWELAGRKFSDDVDLRPIDPYYTIRFHDGQTFEYSGDHEHMRREIAKFSADDFAGYERFLEASAELYRVGFDQLLYASFDTLWSMVRTIPDLIRTQFYRSVYGMVSRYVKHPRLRMIFSFHPLLIGGNPMTTTAVYALIAHLERSHGVHYAMGGTNQIVAGMVTLIERLGGRVHLSSPVKQVLVENGRAAGVELESGIEHRADVVVSNADSASTYRYLVPEQHRSRWTDRRLKKSRFSMSLFVWYFGTRKQYGDVPHHMILLGPRYQGLLADIFDHKTLADDFSLYLHRPTATDPTMAPPGCDAFYVLSPVPNQVSGIDWETAAEPYRQAIAASLEATVLPGLTDNLMTSHLLTPNDFQDRLSSVEGAAFSFEPVLWQTAWFRPHNRSEELPGLYLVGGGTHPGAGMPGVISSAKVLDTVVPDPAHSGASLATATS